MKIILEGRNLSHRARELLVELEAELSSSTPIADAHAVEEAAKVSDSVIKAEEYDIGRNAAGELVKQWVSSIEEAKAANDEITEGDRRVLFASIANMRELKLYLAQQPGAAHQLAQVGASSDIAANILTIGTIVGAWNFTH